MDVLRETDCSRHLVLLVAAALWIAARIYAAGVLLYGQHPGFRSILRMARSGM